MRLMSLLKDDQEVLSPKKSLRHLVSTHFPDGALDPEPAGEDHELIDIENLDLTGICHYITYNKVKAAFSSFGDFKAPGPDLISPIVLKNLDDKHTETIVLLYQLSLATGKIPAAWRYMKVVFIPKAGKADYAIAKAYRPITLSSFLLKALERIVQWYLLEHVIPDPLFNQHAYTKGRSCDTALSTFVNEVEKAIFNDNYVLAISLDCSGAFDCIDFKSAESSMGNKGVPSTVIEWYCSLLSNRTVHAEIQGQQMEVRPKRGSPQGGVLSPLIWNLIMDGLLTQFKRGPVRALGYADDVLLYITGSDPRTMANLIQPSLNDVLKWGKDNGLSFNPTKTTAVLFNNKKRSFHRPPIYMGGAQVMLSKSMVYLGLTIDHTLNWTAHITNRVQKCNFLLSKCRNIISRSWGLTPDKMNWVYTAVIRPKITYGAVVWASYLTLPQIKRLKRTQRLALLPIFQPLRSAPTAGLEVIFGWIPLDLHAQKMGLNTYIRIKGTTPNNWDGVGTATVAKGHIRRWSNTLNDWTMGNLPREDKIDRIIWSDSSIIDESYENPIRIYTDASKYRDNIGYSWVATDGDYIIDEAMISTKDMEVFIAELAAVYDALLWLRKSQNMYRHSEIMTDCQSVAQVLNCHKAKSQLCADTLQQLSSLEGRVKIIWIKGHSGTIGNEVADMLAKQAAARATDIQCTYPYTPVSTRQFKNHVNDFYLNKWQSRWDNMAGYRISKLFVPDVKVKKIGLQMGISELHKLSYIITGHGLFRRHLRHWNEIQDISCALCGEAWEDSWHLWAYCPELQNDRNEINHLLNKGIPLEKGLLNFFAREKIRDLIVANEALLTP